MQTECIDKTFVFQPLDRRDVVGRFDGGTITSDAGALLLREADRATSIIESSAAWFSDFRNPLLIEHEVTELIGQRVYALALGYEDLNDHEELRKDPLLATLAGKTEQQLDLFADRTSTSEFRSSQVRRYFSTVAYMLPHVLSRLALEGTDLEKAQCGTIRLKLLKIGAQVRVTCRKVWISMASGYPYMELFAHVFRKLRALTPLPAS